MTGRAKGLLPKTHEELQAIIDKTWQQACDAEFARADEEYRSMRAAVAAFDTAMAEGRASDRLPRLQGCSPEAAVQLARRLRSVLDAERRLAALDAFEKATGMTIDDPSLACMDARAIHVIRENCGQAGIVASHLRTALEQLDAGRRAISAAADRMEKALSGERRKPVDLQDDVKVLKFTTRVRNALQNDGVTTIEDLCRMRPVDLLHLKNFGHASLGEVRACLAEFGLKLKDDETT